MVTTVALGRVLPPFNVAVTVTEVAASSSPRVLGLAERVIPVGASSSSLIVVVTVGDVLRLGAGPPPPLGLLMLTLKVSPVPSSMLSSVVSTVKVLSPASALVNVKGPALRRVVAPSHSRPVGSAVGDGQVSRRLHPTRTQRYRVVGCGITLIYTRGAADAHGDGVARIYRRRCAGGPALQGQSETKAAWR